MVTRDTNAVSPQAVMTNASAPAYVEQMEQVPAERSADELLPAPQNAAPMSNSEVRSTLVALKGGSAFLAREYCVQGGQLQCISEDGQRRAFPLESVDVFHTVQVNRERNIEFVLRSKDRPVEQ